MAVVTLMTDFGLKDGNVGVMRGVIWGIAPHVHISDLSHLIEPQNILEGSIILGRSAPYFPEGSVHVVVVDPGVGTARRPIAARLGKQIFVGPDNGLMTPLLERAERLGEPVEIVHLTNKKYWLDDVSHVFHGRDIFSPVAAHIANGVPLSDLGERITDPVRLHLPRPERTEQGWKGQVVHIDYFGNVATNLMREDLADVKDIAVRLKGHEIAGLVNTFGERPSGDLIVLYGSTGSLIVSVVNGNAAQRLNARVGDPLDVIEL